MNLLPLTCALYRPPNTANLIPSRNISRRESTYLSNQTAISDRILRLGHSTITYLTTLVPSGSSTRPHRLNTSAAESLYRLSCKAFTHSPQSAHLLSDHARKDRVPRAGLHTTGRRDTKRSGYQIQRGHGAHSTSPPTVYECLYRDRECELEAEAIPPRNLSACAAQT